MNKEKALKNTFGFDKFRYGQEVLVDNILAKRDVLGIMPTGAGKSVCYQLTALMMSGITLIISPLIALMQDQVEALKQKGINAVCINSASTKGINRLIIKEIKKGKYKLVYITPERLSNEDFIKFSNSVNLSFIAIDEAHCVSQWGQDFRPSYLEILSFVKSLNKRPIIGAFTATATQKVRQDIVKLLELKDPFTIVTGFNRSNLYFGVKNLKNRYKLGQMLKFLKDNSTKSGIIYCITRKYVEEISYILDEKGYSVTRYHAGLTKIERTRNQEMFLKDEKKIMVATNAFGMGIDKSNIRFVLHYNMPRNIENYYQEAGRAGRDGKESECILFYSETDIMINRSFIDGIYNDSISFTDQKSFMDKEYKNLNIISEYCKTNECLKRYILSYFGEKSEACGNCSNCLTNFEIIDFTIGAQKILSCVARMNQRYGIKMVTDVLKGIENKRIKDLNFNTISTYGLLRDYSQEEIKSFIRELINKGYLKFFGDKYPVLRLTKNAKKVLYNHEKVYIKTKKKKKIKFKKTKQEDSLLFELLCDMRKKLAEQNDISDQHILSDSVLHNICNQIPTETSELEDINNLSKRKIDLYGKQIIDTVVNYLKTCKNNLENFYPL